MGMGTGAGAGAGASQLASVIAGIIRQAHGLQV